MSGRGLLTRNELAVSGRDPAWRLYVVTRALVDPTVHEYDRDRVAAAAEPYVFSVDLGGA